MCKMVPGIVDVEAYLNLIIRNSDIELDHITHRYNTEEDMETDAIEGLADSHGYYHGRKCLSGQLLEFMKSGYDKGRLPEATDILKYSEDTEESDEEEPEESENPAITPQAPLHPNPSFGAVIRNTQVPNNAVWDSGIATLNTQPGDEEEPDREP